MITPKLISPVTRITTAVLVILLSSPLTLVPVARAQRRAATPEQRTARYYETIRSRPPQLLAFLRRMPKGGDLHNHLSGTIYAENYIKWAADQGLCVNQTTMTFATCDQTPSQEPNQVPASTALTNGVLYRQLID